MSDMALFLGVAAMLCAAYALHGGWLAERWGVDSGRQTPAVLLALHKRRVGSAATVLVNMVSCLWSGITLYLYVWDLNPYKLDAAALAVMLCALVCAVISFAVLFVCVRTGADLAQAASEELFAAAGEILYLLTVLTMLSMSGVVVALLTGNLTEYAMPAYGAVGWLAMSVMTASQRTAPVIRSERHIKPATYGGAVCVGLLTLALCMAAKKQVIVESPVWLAAALAMILIAFVYPACLAGDALRGLLKSPLPKKKKAPDWLWTVLCLACGGMMGVLCGEWLLIAVVPAGIAYVLLAVVTCIKWFYRIGRGLFSRY